MSDPSKLAPGTIVWHDLTVPDADRLRDFYKAVVGWTSSDVDMGGYADYCVHDPASNTVVAGVCHARGVNAGVPAQWLVYVAVADLDASITTATALGGRVIHGPRAMGAQRFCIIQDPAGAVMGLIA